MPKILYFVQRPGEGPVILNACRRLVTGTRFDRATGLYAFASKKGSQLLVQSLANANSGWAAAQKRWIISIDGGITEPEALRYLLGLRKTEVRVPNAEEVLKRRLKPVYRFHPKTLLLETKNTDFTPSAILVGSANLTVAGLSFSHEHALSAHLSDLPVADRVAALGSTGLDDLASLIDAATPIDLNFVARYEAIRPRSPSLPEEFEWPQTKLILQTNAVIPADQSAALAGADHLWVVVEKESKNRGRTREGNQIDMKKGTRVFFGIGDADVPKNSPLGTVLIRYGQHSASRNLRYGNNSMDKIDLPIPDQEGPPSYRNQTLLFSRQPDGSFRLDLGSSDQIRQWKETSDRRGTRFHMERGTREFGVF
jgi:HKD family nuclease